MGPGVVIALGIVGMLSFGVFMPLFVLEIPGLEVLFTFLILAVVGLLMRTLGSRLPDRMGPKKTGIFATTALIIGMAGLATTKGPYWAYLAIVPFAIGQALQYPGLLSLTFLRALADWSLVLLQRSAGTTPSSRPPQSQPSSA